MMSGKISNKSSILNLSHATIENAIDGILWINHEAKIVRANNTACKLLECSEDELLKKTVMDFDIGPPWKNFEIFWKKIKDKKTIIYETVVKPIKSPNFPAEAAVCYVEFDKKAYICGSFRDISERKKNEKTLKESEKILKTILNHQFQYTGLLDPKGHIKIVNKNALDILNLKEAEVIGKLFWETPWWTHSSKEQKKAKKGIERATKGEFVRFESMHIDKDGNSLNIDNSLTPIFDERGNIEYIVPEARDITEVIAARDKLKKMNMDLVELKNRLESENIYLQEEIKTEHNFGDMIGQSSEFCKVLGQIENVAAADTNVLILGETGTGKELVARAIHNLSNRKNHPLVKVNCAALPANLIESELFGHEKGAFTGALLKKIGRFELADRGTIFLDEIGDLPLDLQSKLLRVLQENEFERLGNSNTLKVDVRIIAATNRKLKKLVLEGNFREDLFYRLNVFPVECPPLRERKGDIEILIKHILSKLNTKLGKNIDTIPANIMTQFKRYNWPGNIRELENVIERAVLYSKTNRLELGDWFLLENEINLEQKTKSLDDFERQHIIKTLEKTGWKVSGPGGAAEILGLKFTTLFSKMKKLGIKKNNI